MLLAEQEEAPVLRWVTEIFPPFPTFDDSVHFVLAIFRDSPEILPLPWSVTAFGDVLSTVAAHPANATEPLLLTFRSSPLVLSVHIHCGEVVLVPATARAVMVMCAQAELK